MAWQGYDTFVAIQITLNGNSAAMVELSTQATLPEQEHDGAW